MLKILENINKKENYKKLSILSKEGDFIAATRHYSPANKEWFNSVYSYNKNSLILLPVADNLIIQLIRSYFNMYSRFLEKKNKAPRMRKWKRRLSCIKFWISKPEIKHTNDKVIINIYIYNRQKKQFLSKIRKLLSYKLIKYINKSIKLKSNKFILAFNKFSTKLLSILNLNDKSFNKIENFFLISLIKRSLKKEIYIMHFMQSLFFNKFKFTSLYIEPLKIILSKIYKKKIVLNIVKLKSYYLNSDILTQIVTTKTSNRKLKIYSVLQRCLLYIKTPVIHKRLIVREPTKFISKQNIVINKRVQENKDGFNIILSKLRKNSRLNMLNSIKNKTVNGIRFEASGRLTRRLIAQRAVSMLRHVGTLKNVDSSFKGLSTVILRGNTRSNTQLTKLKSKRRIGSFGIKGWVSCI